MRLIDSSAWIEYYRPDGRTLIADLVEQAIVDDEAAVNGVIVVEILGFARRDARDLIERDFSALHQVELDSDVISRAVEICARLRDTGTTVPATDALIAASAIKAGAALVHCDGHFRQIATVFPIELLDE